MSRSFLPLAAALLAGGVAACVGGYSSTGSTGGTITIDNQSDFILDEVHVTSVGSRSWGPNLVPDQLQPGDEIDVDTFDCDYYDVLIVDEFGTNCVLSDLDLCFSNDLWVIDNNTLAACAFQQ